MSLVGKGSINAILTVPISSFVCAITWLVSFPHKVHQFFCSVAKNHISANTFMFQSIYIAFKEREMITGYSRSLLNYVD